MDSDFNRILDVNQSKSTTIYGFDCTSSINQVTPNEELEIHSADLNRLVADLFDNETGMLLIDEPKLEITKNEKKRMRKSAYQISILKQELRANPEWSKEDMLTVSAKSGLEQYQVYKWYWDQQKKTKQRRRNSPF